MQKARSDVRAGFGAPSHGVRATWFWLIDAYNTAHLVELALRAPLPPSNAGQRQA